MNSLGLGCYQRFGNLPFTYINVGRVHTATTGYKL